MEGWRNRIGRMEARKNGRIGLEGWKHGRMEE
jgi:hypothetical protein